MEGRLQPVSIELDGQHYTGDWRLIGREVSVGSAYGSRRAQIGRSQPERVAARVLQELVTEWRAPRN